MLLNGMVKLLEIKREGITSKNKEAYVHICALSYDNNEQFIMIHAYGENAEYLKRNLNSPRRAFVSGTLSTDSYTKTEEITKTLVIGGKKKKVAFSVDVEKTSIRLDLLSCQFIDKKKDEEIEVNDDDSEEIIIIEEDESVDSKSVEVEIDESEEETVIEIDETKKPKSTTAKARVKTGRK